MNTIMKENEGRHYRTELSKIQMKACSSLFVTALWGRRALIFQKEGYCRCCFGESEIIWNDTEKACVKQVRYQTKKQQRPPSNDGFQSTLFSSGEQLYVWSKILFVAIWQLSLLDLGREAKIQVMWFLFKHALGKTQGLLLLLSIKNMLRKHFAGLYFEDTAVLLLSLSFLYLSISVRPETQSAK